MSNVLLVVRWYDDVDFLTKERKNEYKVCPLAWQNISIVNGDFNITGITGSHSTPTEIQLRNVKECSIDVYALQDGSNSCTSDRDGVINGNSNTSWGCNSRYSDIYNFGKIFSGSSGWMEFPPLTNVIDGYTAIPNHNYTLHKNYCAITLKMKTGKTCTDLNFGSNDAYFKDASGTKIASAVPTFDSIKVKCGNNTELINYPVTNSMVTFDPNKSPSTIIFTPNNNENLEYEYQCDDKNYVAFSCNSDNTSVEVVDYRCGL